MGTAFIELYPPELRKGLGYVEAADGGVAVGEEAFRGEVEGGHVPEV